MLPCTDKYKLINLLEMFGATEPPDDAQQQLQDASGLQGDAVGLKTMEFTHTEGDPSRKITLVDGMVPQRRNGDKGRIRFSIRLEMIPSSNTSQMSRFLSHDKTKADLTEYLAARTLEKNKNSSKVVVTSSSGHARSSSELLFEDNNHEKVDTLLIYHAMLVSRRNHARDVVLSLDTDVLVVIANYDGLLLRSTFLSMASGVIQVQPVWGALDPKRAKALPALHAFSGTDNTTRFSRIDKATWLQVYLKADGEVVKAFQMPLKSPMTCPLCWLHSSLLHTHQRTSRLQVSPNCDGTCSADICLLPSVFSSSPSPKSRSRPQYGVRQALLSSSL